MPAEEAEAIAEAKRERERDEDFRTATVCWAVFTAGGMKKRGGGSWAPSDFMPSPPMTDEARERVNEARMAVLASAARGKAKRALAKHGKLSTS